MNQLGNPREGIATLKRAVAIYDQLLALKPQDAGRLADSGRAWQTLMDVASSPGGGFLDFNAKDEVMADGNKAITRFEAELEISPLDSAALLGIVRVYTTEGGVQTAVDPLLGMTTIRKGLDTFHRLPAAVQSSPEGLIEEARLASAVGLAQYRMGQYKEALGPLERAREILDGFAVADPKNSTNQSRRANVYRTRAGIDFYLNKKQEALADYRKTIEIYDGMVTVRSVCEGYVAKILAGQGRMGEAAPYAKASIDDLENLADRPEATVQYLNEAAIVLMVTPVLSLRDYPRALRYALRADQLSNGRGSVYLPMAYANNGEAAKALDVVERFMTMFPAPPPGQKPSDARQNLENERRDIKILIKTGHLPPGFNQ